MGRTSDKAERLALTLLAAMERRSLPEAQALLAPTFEMVFPGPARFTSLAEMAAAAKDRYRSIAKLVDEVESFDSHGRRVVYVRGTLYGTNAHGVEFADVRFVDRFVVNDESLERQDVWNDLAESGVLTRRS